MTLRRTQLLDNDIEPLRYGTKHDRTLVWVDCTDSYGVVFWNNTTNEVLALSLVKTYEEATTLYNSKG